MKKKLSKSISKSAIILWVCLLATISCQKSEWESDVIKATFGYRLVESNSMYLTKAITNEEIIFDIQQKLPSSVNLTFKPQSGNEFVVQTGVETDIAVGTYTVSGYSSGGQVGDPINSGCYFTWMPYITFAASVDIIKGQSQYFVNGTYKSFAIVVDYDEISKAQYKNISGQWKDVEFLRFDNAGLIFAQGNYNEVPIQIKLIPADDTYKETTFGFSTNSATQKYTFVEPGKFYKLHPVLNDGTNQTIEIIYVDFVEGTVKE